MSSNVWKMLTIVPKSSILDIGEGSEYACIKVPR